MNSATLEAPAASTSPVPANVPTNVPDSKTNAKPLTLTDTTGKPTVPQVTSGKDDGKTTVTDTQVSAYCDKVIAGKPTGKSFPDKLSNIAFTDEQRAEIRAARATHKLDSMNAKKAILGMLRGKHVHTIGHRTNKTGALGTVRYVNEKILGKPMPDSMIYGAAPKSK